MLGVLTLLMSLSMLGAQAVGQQAPRVHNHHQTMDSNEHGHGPQLPPPRKSKIPSVGQDSPSSGSQLQIQQHDAARNTAPPPETQIQPPVDDQADDRRDHQLLEVPERRRHKSFSGHHARKKGHFSRTKPSLNLQDHGPHEDDEHHISLAQELEQISELLQSMTKKVPHYVRERENFFLALTTQAPIMEELKALDINSSQKHLGGRSGLKTKKLQKPDWYRMGKKVKKHHHHKSRGNHPNKMNASSLFPNFQKKKKFGGKSKKKVTSTKTNLIHTQNSFQTDDENLINSLASEDRRTLHPQGKRHGNSSIFHDTPKKAQGNFRNSSWSHFRRHSHKKHGRIHKHPPPSEGNSTERSQERRLPKPFNTSSHLHRNGSRPANHTRKRRFKLGGFKLSKQEARQEFQKYYDCIGRKMRAWTEQNDFNIHIELATEGQEVKMTCIICTRPDEDPNEKLVGWQHLRKSNTALVPVEESDNVKISKDFTLTIKSVDIEDAGQYFCVEDGDYAIIYMVDVLLHERRRRVMDNETNTLHKEKDLADRNLHLFTIWTEWSGCNKCNKPGQRQKVGLCMVKKMRPGQPITPNDYPVVELYVDGIPCHSTALPRGLARIKDIRFRPSETLIGPCQIPCPTTPKPIVITDESGEVIEVINAGFFPLRAKPTLPAMVKRKVMFEDEGTHIIFKCPHATNRDLIRWQRGTRIINPLTIRRQTRGRVWIDKKQQFHIKKLLKADTDAYHCWAKEKRIASFKLITVEAMSADLKTYISFAGIAVTGLAVVTICLRFYCKRNQMTAK